MKCYGLKFRSILLFFFAIMFSQTARSEKADVLEKPLDWRTIAWQSLNFSRIPVDGGAGIYALPERGVRKFRLSFLFAGGMYGFPRERAAEVSAAVDNLILGGAGNRTYEELSRYVSDNGISLETKLNEQGDLVLTVEALTADFSKALALINDVLLRPRFDKNAFQIWKQDKIDEFTSLSDAGDAKKQMRFMNYVMNRMSLGENHFLTQTLQRSSPRVLNSIQPERFAEVAKAMVARIGLNVVLSGGFSKAHVASLQSFVVAIPVGNILPEMWLVERPSPSLASGQKVRVAIIQKPDMKQASAELRIVVPHVGRLSTLERVDLGLAEEVLSSSAGVVGNDRWSKAMRGDSGLSYSPHASFSERILEPNTNVGAWRLIFQSPLERVDEACLLAHKTWSEFSSQGILSHELASARVKLMNLRLAKEETIFDKAAAFEANLARGELPNPVPAETLLSRLELARGELARVNSTISRLGHSSNPAYLVLMGNIGKEKIDKILRTPGFDVASVVMFEDVLKQIQ
jgi:hypothetical protein